MEYKIVNINDWSRTGEGASASSYVNKNDDNYMLKLFNKNIKEDIVIKEYDMAKNVSSLGISTPEVYDIVVCDGRYGITYQNIKNKKSITRWIEIDIDKYIKIFADEARKLHNIKADTGKLISQKKLLLDIVSGIKGMKIQYRDRFIDIINNTEETYTCMHGDLSTGNLIVAGDIPYWIDLADFSYGNPIFDIGMLYFDLKSDVMKTFRKILYKMPIKKLNLIWDIFIKNYLETDDKNKIYDFEIKIRPYAALSVINYIHKSDFPIFLSNIIINHVAKIFLNS